MNVQIPEIDGESVADAVDVLGDVKSWKLTDPRWHAVVQVIEMLEAAWAGRDVEAFRAATTDE